MDERNARPEVRPKQTEIVKVGVPQLLPVNELDAELERRIGLADELVLFDSKEAVELLDRRDGGLADADRACRTPDRRPSAGGRCSIRTPCGESPRTGKLSVS